MPAGLADRTFVVLLSVTIWLTAPAAQAARFLGSSSCRVCHAAAYEAWEKSPHAHAVESLPRENQKDTRCLECHARDAAQGGDPGVTCETCHGAGQYYWPKYVMRDSEVSQAAGLVAKPDLKSCELCHDAFSPSLRPFDPAAAMQAIDHWSAERAARQGHAARACPRGADTPAAQALAAEPRPADRFLGRVLTGSWQPAPRRHPGKSTRRSAVPAKASRVLTAQAGEPAPSPAARPGSAP